MDLADQVAEPAAEHAPAGEDERSYTREDGTLVINILVEPACGESTEREIVVCAPGQSEHRLNAPEPPAEEEGFKPEVQVAPNATARLRPETDPQTGAQRIMVDFVTKF